MMSNESDGMIVGTLNDFDSEDVTKSKDRSKQKRIGTYWNVPFHCYTDHKGSLNGCIDTTLNRWPGALRLSSLKRVCQRGLMIHTTILFVPKFHSRTL